MYHSSMDFLKRKSTQKLEPIVVSTDPIPITDRVESSKKSQEELDTPKDVKSDKVKVNVNVLLVKKSDQNEPSLTDKKIEMKYIKDGRAHRTFVFNLELHIKDKKLLNNTIIPQMKKSFGTSCPYKETEF